MCNLDRVLINYIYIYVIHMSCNALINFIICMSSSIIMMSTSTCDNDKLWIEEFLNMDDIDDDEYHYCSSSPDFGETYTNNTYMGASTDACPELDHNNLLHHDPPVPQIQGGGSTFKISFPSKRRKVAAAAADHNHSNGHEQVIMNNNIAHITVERNRRKQMNHNLSLLRSLMPSFYVKRRDQASIIGGVIDYINELQLLLQSLEAKKQRKFVVLSPRQLLISSPRKLPLSPRLILPITPTTPQPTTPYKPPLHAAAGQYSPTLHVHLELPSPSSVSSNIVCVNELVASSNSAMANVEVKFSGQNNLLLKTVSPKIPGQALKIISTLEKLALEILHVSISIIDDTMLNSFTIKIGIECQLSAEELAEQVQQTFC